MKQLKDTYNQAKKNFKKNENLIHICMDENFETIAEISHIISSITLSQCVIHLIRYPQLTF